MKSLDGSELAGFIKERQAKQIRTLRQAHRVFPKLAIIVTKDDPVINIYIKLKQTYGQDILIDVMVHHVEQTEVSVLIQRLNQDTTIHGIIVQLPLADPIATDDTIRLIAPSKDVDGLGDEPSFIPATAMAIDWLLAGYNVPLADKTVLIVGHGRLVGRPLERLWLDNGLSPIVADDTTQDLNALVKKSDVIVTATGVPRLITSTMIKPGAVIVDAGTASEHGKIIGDVDDSIRQRDDVMITPVRGGVGPLTVAALFDNVIQAAQATVD